MTVKIRTWGNSQGIRIPKEILDDAGVRVDDLLDISASDGVIILSRPFHHRSLEERAKAYCGKLNLDGEFDWGEPVGREKWD